MKFLSLCPSEGTIRTTVLLALLGGILSNMFAIWRATDNAKAYCRAENDPCEQYSKAHQPSDSIWGSALNMVLLWESLLIFLTLIIIGVARRCYPKIKETEGQEQASTPRSINYQVNNSNRNSCLARFFYRIKPRKWVCVAGGDHFYCVSGLEHSGYLSHRRCRWSV